MNRVKPKAWTLSCVTRLKWFGRSWLSPTVSHQWSVWMKIQFFQMTIHQHIPPTFTDYILTAFTNHMLTALTNHMLTAFTHPCWQHTNRLYQPHTNRLYQPHTDRLYQPHTDRLFQPHTDRFQPHTDRLYRPHADHILTTFTNHIPTAFTNNIPAHCLYQPHTECLYRPHTDHVLTTYWPDQLVYFYSIVHLIWHQKATWFPDIYFVFNPASLEPDVESPFSTGEYVYDFYYPTDNTSPTGDMWVPIPVQCD